METRRDFLKKGAYAAPVVLTLKAAPALADHASHKPKKQAVSLWDLLRGG